MQHHVSFFVRIVSARDVRASLERARGRIELAAEKRWESGRLSVRLQDIYRVCLQGTLASIRLRWKDARARPAKEHRTAADVARSLTASPLSLCSAELPLFIKAASTTHRVNASLHRRCILLLQILPRVRTPIILAPSRQPRVLLALVAKVSREPADNQSDRMATLDKREHAYRTRSAPSKVAKEG